MSVTNSYDVTVGIYNDNTEPVRFEMSGRYGNSGIVVSVIPDRESAMGNGELRKGGINVSTLGTIGPIRMAQVLLVMSLAMGIYNDGMENLDKVLPEMERMCFEVNDHRNQ